MFHCTCIKISVRIFYSSADSTIILQTEQISLSNSANGAYIICYQSIILITEYPKTNFLRESLTV